jgi:hypothetical protein
MWIVTWTIITMFIVSCPEPVKTPNEFGVVQPTTSMTLQACYDTNKREMSKEFNTKEEAEAFIAAGKKKYPDKVFHCDEAVATDWKLYEKKTLD